MDLSNCSNAIQSSIGKPFVVDAERGYGQVCFWLFSLCFVEPDLVYLHSLVFAICCRRSVLTHLS